MAALNSLHDLLIHELKDLYSAEKQMLRSLPKMAKAASSTKLKSSFEKHKEQTEEQVSRLEQCFEALEVAARGPKCVGMEGLIEEGKKMIQEDADESVRDAALIGAAQKAEHYEIAGYGTAITYAEMLGEKKVAKILKQTLAEEKETDEKLTELAESEVNVEANV